jgi:osmotically-inducible protein OsmY
MKLPQLSALFVMTAAPLMLFASSATDRQIENAAKSSYNFRVVLDNHVTAQAMDGVVTLTGNVPDNGQKALAEYTADNLPGVVRVGNQIKVESEAAERSDDGIALKIHNLLLLRAAINATAIKVNVSKGALMLTGSVDNMTQRGLAEDDLDDVEGVQSVNNGLSVKNPTANNRVMAEAVDDASIIAQIKYLLLSHRPTQALKTVVTAKGGVVRITGDVKSGYEKDMVSHFTESVRGVKSFTNDIAVHDN